MSQNHSHPKHEHGHDHDHQHEHRGHDDCCASSAPDCGNEVDKRVNDHGHAHEHHDDCCGPAAIHTAPRGNAIAALRPGDETLLLHIPTMDCAVEEGEIRTALADISGIRALNFRLGERTLSLSGSPQAVSQAIAAIGEAGFESKPLQQAGPRTAASMGSGLWRLGLALALAIGAEVLADFAPPTIMFKAAGMALAAAAIALAGLSTYKKGWAALRRGRLNINALMSVAATGAFLIGQWPEAAMVMALYAIAELIEARSIDRARNAIKGLLELAPDTAEMRQADGAWREVPSGEVPVETVIRVKPGARIPLDGLVTAGASAVNQAPVTGESIPVDKAAGDTVFAGTINETGTIELRTTATASGTVLARIIHAVEEAQATRAPMQRFVDRFSAVYTPAVFLIAVAVAVLAPWLLGWPWQEAAYKALVLLVIACPCALVIATPVTVVTGLAAAARRGILIKGGVYLEEARRVRVVAMDKTGTITEGKPKLVDTEILPSELSKGRTLDLASALASHSDHPVSKAIARGLDRPGLPIDNFMAFAGRGVLGTVDGKTLTLGNHRMIEEQKLCNPHIERRLRAHEEAGRTVTLLASPTQVLAIFAVADTIKETSKAAVVMLHRMGIASAMLTGDNPATARAIAAQAGIDDARGNLLPGDKLAAITELQGRYGPTAMIGDGINDAPALAKSDLGVAMGAAGTDTAMEAADVVIMNDDLRRVAETVALSRHTSAVLWQNIILALGIKSLFLVLALLGSATMWMAVFADMGASLLVVFNGLRLLRWNGLESSDD